MSNKTLSQVFEKLGPRLGRGFGPMDSGLPDNFLDGKPSRVLATIAERYAHPDPKYVNSYSQSMVKLAKFAAGLSTLNGDEYHLLYRTVEEYESIQKARTHGHPQSVRFAAFVRKHAAARAAHEHFR